MPAALELPTLPKGAPVCPAALKIEGVTTYDGGCICRVMEADQQAEDGVGMNPAQLETAREGTGGVYVTVASDPATVTRFCFGAAVPVLENRDGQRRNSYTYCPVWQTRRERDIEARERLFDPVETDGVSMGVDVEPIVESSEDALRELAPLPGETRAAR